MRWMFIQSALLWMPSSLTDLRCWLDASDAATITESSGEISLWEDKAGSNDADDAVDGSNNKITTARPTVASSAQNGLDAIGFDGTEWFDHNSAKGMLRNRSCALIAIAVKFGSTIGTTFAMANRQSPLGGTRCQLSNSTTVIGIRSQRLDADSSIAVTTSSAPPRDTDWHIHVGVMDWADDTLAYYVDGALIGTDSYPSGGANTSDTDLASLANTWTAIGASRRTGELPLPSGSRIGEIVCAAKASGSYTTSDREKLEGYLAHKWGLEANLPAGHPYLSVPPSA